MFSLFAWSPLVPRRLAGILLLGLLAGMVVLIAWLAATAQMDIGSWRWPETTRLG